MEFIVESMFLYLVSYYFSLVPRWKNTILKYSLDILFEDFKRDSVVKMIFRHVGKILCGV